ncbi:sigma-E factor negative regulatory protein [Salinisphaera aquimarina]|uniref:Sigma-E factor negative regulatory protein n=1 Tax=Salinisphaera aquimarina TaxID=2094031 RepID=A0ABV7ERN1_9GAMM
MNEQFSAFLDNEATRDESDSVLNALLRDEQLRESWSRQQWLRTTLRAHRGEVATELDIGFSTRVMQAIAAEDQGETPMVADSRVVPLRRSSAGRRRWRSMTGLALAASAAGAVFLVSSGSLQSDGVGGDAMPGATVATADAASGTPTRVASTRDVANTPSDTAGMVASNELEEASVQQASDESTRPVRQGPADHWSVSDPALQDELNSYLVEHNGLARGYGLAGTTPAFVRVATYGQEPTQ